MQDQYEQFINRPTLKLENSKIHPYIEGKHILITGAAGSIGSNLTKSIILYKPAIVTLIDINELGLILLKQQISLLADTYPEIVIQYVLADITYKPFLKRRFKKQKPDIIYHIAAVKHVSFLENHAEYALRVNLIGTKIIADLAIHWSSEKCIFISTDKAVNPINVMGSSKYLAEKYISSLPHTKTQFIVTRLGNVLGSSGSVIPIFLNQIERGEEITLTDLKTERYFISMNEACHFLILATTSKEKKEILIFDMGLPIKVYKIALGLINRHKLKTGKEVRIIVTGLKNGEKMKEELLHSWEKSIVSYNTNILKVNISINIPSYPLHTLPRSIYDRATHKLLRKAFPKKNIKLALESST